MLVSKESTQEKVMTILYDKVKEEFKTTGESKNLEEILYEFTDKDDLVEVYSYLFAKEKD